MAIARETILNASDPPAMNPPPRHKRNPRMMTYLVGAVALGLSVAFILYLDRRFLIGPSTA